MLAAKSPAAVTPKTRPAAMPRPHRRRQHSQATTGRNRSAFDIFENVARPSRTAAATSPPGPNSQRVPGRRAVAACNLLVQPAEVRHQTEREVEQLRRNPDEVDRHDGGHDEGAGQQRRQCRRHPRVQEQVPAPGDQRQQQRVEHQEAVGAEERDERRREERVDERLAVEEAVRIGDPRRCAVQTNGGRRIRPASFDVAGRASGTRRTDRTGTPARPERDPRADRSGRRRVRGCGPSCNRSPRRSGYPIAARGKSTVSARPP